MMAKRLLAILIALAFLSSSGCCWLRRLLCDECCSPCDTGAFTYYAGRSCGEEYWGDWHSHPPRCDPCDACGNYVGACSCPASCGPSPAPAMMTVGTDGCGCGCH